MFRILMTDRHRVESLENVMSMPQTTTATTHAALGSDFYVMRNDDGQKLRAPLGS